MRVPVAVLGLLVSSSLLSAQPFPGTPPLETKADLSAELVSGIDRYLDRVLKAAPERRGRHWRRDLSSPEAYVASVATNRHRLAGILGVVERRDPPRLRMTGPATSDPSTHPALVGTGTGFRVYAVDWDVLRGVKGEGLLLVPDSVRADVVAVPDCDWTRSRRWAWLRESPRPTSSRAVWLRPDAGCWCRLWSTGATRFQGCRGSG